MLRCADYRDNDRMLTLLSPARGRIEAIARGCRKPRSPLLNASELFALGDYELFEKNGRATVTSVSLIETFYALRMDYDRLACGAYLLNVCEAVAQPGVPARPLFMLLVHSLSRLAFSDQEWKPLLAGFLLNLSVIEGYKPRINHCVRCGRRIGDGEPAFFDPEGGLVCQACPHDGLTPVAPEQIRWMRQTLERPASGWINEKNAFAPFTLLRGFIENRLEQKIKTNLPDGA